MKNIVKVINLIAISVLVSCSSGGYIQMDTIDPKTQQVASRDKVVLPTAVAGDQSFEQFALTMPNGTKVDIRNYKTVNPNPTLTKTVGTLGVAKITAGTTEALSNDHVRVVDSNNTAAVNTIKEKGKAAAVLKGTPDVNKPLFSAPIPAGQ